MYYTKTMTEAVKAARRVGAVCVVALAALLAGCSGSAADKPRSAVPADSIPMMVMQIKQCSRLYTTEYKVRKIISYDDEKTIQGKVLGKDFSLALPFGKRAVAIPIDATVKAYIDFSDFSAANIVCHNEKIEITLPDPALMLTSTRIDHDGVKQRVSLLRGDFTDSELTELEHKGRTAIVESIHQLGIVASARANAAALLIPMIEQMGFDRDNITINFRKDFAPADIIKMLTKQTVEKNVEED